MASENPYLAHLAEPHQRVAGSSNGAGSNPFDGWMARKVNGEMVEKAMVSHRKTYIVRTLHSSGDPAKPRDGRQKKKPELLPVDPAWQEDNPRHR